MNQFLQANSVLQTLRNNEINNNIFIRLFESMIMPWVCKSIVYVLRLRVYMFAYMWERVYVATYGEAYAPVGCPDLISWLGD